MKNQRHVPCLLQTAHSWDLLLALGWRFKVLSSQKVNSESKTVLLPRNCMLTSHTRIRIMYSTPYHLHSRNSSETSSPTLHLPADNRPTLSEDYGQTRAWTPAQATAQSRQGWHHAFGGHGLTRSETLLLPPTTLLRLHLTCRGCHSQL